MTSLGEIYREIDSASTSGSAELISEEIGKIPVLAQQAYRLSEAHKSREPLDWRFETAWLENLLYSSCTERLKVNGFIKEQVKAYWHKAGQKISELGSLVLRLKVEGLVGRQPDDVLANQINAALTDIKYYAQNAKNWEYAASYFAKHFLP